MNGDLARKDDMDGPDPRLLKFVQQLDAERAVRLKPNGSWPHCGQR